jgi:hypothetical protein
MSISNPRIVGAASQPSNTSAFVNVVTTAPINGGDVIMLIAASELNMRPTNVGCSGVVTTDGRADPNQGSGRFTGGGLVGDIAQMRSTMFLTYAGEDLPIGTTFSATFGGAAGAKAVTVVAISGASVYRVAPTLGVNSASGAGNAIGWTCSVAANLMMVSASVVSGGAGDSYTEDPAWTFLGMSGPGAWPAIRVAYKSSGAGGAISYALTDVASRNWVSGGLFLQ